MIILVNAHGLPILSRRRALSLKALTQTLLQSLVLLAQRVEQLLGFVRRKFIAAGRGLLVLLFILTAGTL